MLPRCFPGGVADEDGTIGYVDLGSTGVGALALDNGRLKWTAPVTGRPVAVTTERVAILHKADSGRNALQVMLIDRTQPDAVITPSAILEFPEQVAPSVVPGPLFTYRVVIEDSDLIVEWRGTPQYRGGTAPPHRAQPPLSSKAAAGRWRVDLTTAATHEAPVGTEHAARPPASLEADALFSYQIGASDAWTTEPWYTGEQWAAISGSIDAERQALALIRWDPRTGRAEPPVALVKGEALISYVSSDGAFVFIHSEARQSSPSPWWIFTAASGTPVTVLQYEEGTREACVYDSQVFYTVDQRAAELGQGVRQSVLKARHISGALLWQAPLSSQATRKRPALRSRPDGGL